MVLNAHLPIRRRLDGLQRGSARRVGEVFRYREKRVSTFSKNCSRWIMQTNARGVRLTIHPTLQTQALLRVNMPFIRSVPFAK